MRVHKQRQLKVSTLESLLVPPIMSSFDTKSNLPNLYKSYCALRRWAVKWLSEDSKSKALEAANFPVIYVVVRRFHVKD